MVLNPKGGSGKSTLAFNIAGYLAGTGRRVALVDMDIQGSSSHWLKLRGEKLPYIHAIPAPYESSSDRLKDQIVGIPKEYDFAVIDAPASICAEDLSDFTVGAHAILIPVVPSAFDIHAASRLVKDLLLVARVSRTKGRLGIVANRIRVRTLSYRRLQNFLDSLSIAVVGQIRDSQNYVQAAYKGLCIHEMAPSAVRSDLEQWQAIAVWIEQRLAAPLTERDWFRTEVSNAQPQELHERQGRVALLQAAAAVLAAVGVSFFLWQMTLSDPAPAEPTMATQLSEAMATQPSGTQTSERIAASPTAATAATAEPAAQRAVISRSLADVQSSAAGIPEHLQVADSSP
ncbi:MAG TPA: ParA family protein, partial [Gammaproteobacteria bacterium]|nr:ParA family protein [Gammaproteobacteria bacterium]